MRELAASINYLDVVLILTILFWASKGYRNGFFSDEEEDKIAHEINESGADMVFVAIPSPKKEIFNEKYRSTMHNVRLIMGVGGTFDVISGKVKRAPRWMQDNGLEWLYRLILEPRRMWKRYLFGNLKFIRLVMMDYFKSNKTILV